MERGRGKSKKGLLQSDRIGGENGYKRQNVEELIYIKHTKEQKKEEELPNPKKKKKEEKVTDDKQQDTKEEEMTIKPSKKNQQTDNAKTNHKREKSEKYIG